jgi:hypothetical protein
MHEEAEYPGQHAKAIKRKLRQDCRLEERKRRIRQGIRETTSRVLRE